MKKFLILLFLSSSMLTTFADEYEYEDHGRGRGRGRDHDDYSCVIPEPSTYAAIGFMGLVVGTVIWNKKRKN
jgi:hypothetical protein